MRGPFVADAASVSARLGKTLSEQGRLWRLNGGLNTSAQEPHHLQSARRRATSYRVTPVAIPALRDSTAEDIGIDTIWSQVSLTSRESPLPSEPVSYTHLT